MMKKLLMLLCPLLAFGLGSCEDDKVNYDVTMVCLNMDNGSREQIKTEIIKLQESTFVTAGYIEKKGLAPEIEGYYYHSFHGPAGRVVKNSRYILLYSALKYTLTINYRNFTAPDEPLAPPVTVELPYKTDIDEEWLRENDHIPAFTGLVLRSVDPASVTIEGDRSVTVFYETEKLDVAVKYRHYNDLVTPLAEDMLLEEIEYGTVVDLSYLMEADAVKDIQNYTYNSLSPASLTVTGPGVITVLYQQNLARGIRFRYMEYNGSRIDNNDRFEDIPIGTVVNEDWARNKGLIKNIYGYDFHNLNPVSVTITDSNAIIDIQYVKKQGNVTVEYWLDKPLAEPEKSAQSQPNTYHVNDVIADYDQLVADGAIVAENIPQGYEFARMEPEANVTVAEGETIIKVHYKPVDVPVTIRYWKGKKDQVGTTLGAVDEQATIPFGTAAEGADGYRKLVDMGSVKPEYLPEGYIFDRLDPVQITTEEGGTVVDIYYTNRVPVTIIYYQGAPGVVGTTICARDENREIIYGSEITSYADLEDYIVPGNIPAGYVFHSMDPQSATIDREGIEIRLYYIEDQP